MDISCLKSCTPIQKRSIIKVAIELVKADNRIHSKEISVLDNLQRSLGLTQAELDLVHYTPLSDAVSVVRQMDSTLVEITMEVLNSIMRVDSDIDFEENLLYAAVTLSCLQETRDWSTILSVPDLDIDLSERQIVYLEKEFSEDAHKVFDDRYDNLLISKAFGDIGLDLFYLPNVLDDLGLSGRGVPEKFGLLQKSMSYLMPAGDMLKVDGLKDTLSTLDTKTFFKVVGSRFGLIPEFFPFKAFLLVKIRGSVVLDDDNAIRNTVDFFCLDISSDVKHRILTFVSLFGDNTYLLPYDGYYRFLFDYFSSEAKLNSEVCLDSEYNFTLPSIGGRKIAFESSPQARTLYLLLLKYGQTGISQDLFNTSVQYLESLDKSEFSAEGVFDIDVFEQSLLKGHEPWRDIIFNTIRIYRSISTKDEQKENFLSYIISILSRRSSLKTYLNKGFGSVEGLLDKELYYVLFDKAANSYRVSIGMSMFLIEDVPGRVIPLVESNFWKSLR